MGWAALCHTTPRRSDPRCPNLLSTVPATDPMSPSSPPPLVPPLRNQRRDVQQGDKGARVNALLPSSDVLLQSHPPVAPIIHCVAGVWRSPHLQRGQLAARLGAVSVAVICKYISLISHFFVWTHFHLRAVRFVGVRYSLLLEKTKKAL
ncbi:hypothetical protein VPH35_028777 [Triticum aestivum]